MKVNVQLDEKYTEPQALILTDKITDEINRAVELISGSSTQVILGFSGGKLTPLDENLITRFYSFDGKVFAVAGNEEFTLKATPHNYCHSIAQPDFSSDCTKTT